MKKSFLFWLIAIGVTFLAIIFQRQTGPTYPKKVSFQIDTLTHNFQLPRSSNIDKEVEVSIPALPWEYTAKLYYRPFPSNEEWEENLLWPEGDYFTASLPEVSQPAAKMEYYIAIESVGSDETMFLPEEPLVIRYKGSVPAWALVPHIILIFLGLIFSNVSGVMAAFGDERYKPWAMITLLFILVGGLIFGPIVQKFAFGEFWTGFPNGKDLTDNKTLIMFLVWLVAVLANLKRPNRTATIVAAIVALVVYCIPHSMRGSEFNYETGEIMTGFIMGIKSIL